MEKVDRGRPNLLWRWVSLEDDTFWMSFQSFCELFYEKVKNRSIKPFNLNINKVKLRIRDKFKKSKFDELGTC